MTCLLSCREMGLADRAAIAAGVAEDTLMEAAGWQVARVVRRRYTPRPVLVLCGPGNNGGDGYVAARLLARWGWPVRIAAAGPSSQGAAGRMAALWHGPRAPLVPQSLRSLPGAGPPLVIDALFGAGLSRPLDGDNARMIAAVIESGADVIAVDVPSGLHGDSGKAMGVVAPASATVTFFRPKPGHLLLPGRSLCGTLIIGDIGLEEAVLTAIAPCTGVNTPDLWGARFPWPPDAGHKYARGHLLVAGGATLTGAARLVADAARRCGAGLVTIVAPESALATYRGDRPGTMVRENTDWPHLLADHRTNALVVGPGLGVGTAALRLALDGLAAGKACVIDADALSSFAEDPGLLWAAGGTKVLTPHDGEYARLFRHTGDRLTRARAAAEESGAVVLLKGPDTVIAAPDGRAAINANAPPTLATGGTGDVLAGLIGGLMAQGMASFESACAAAWLHGDIATRAGPGLIAEDLADGVPAALQRLRSALRGGDRGSPSSPEEGDAVVQARRMLVRKVSTRFDRWSA